MPKLLLPTVMLCAAMFWATTAVAAELPLPAARSAARRAYCGPCGCLQVTHVYHPELRSTYGLNFDPRNYDQTRPHFYLGRVRAYPRYFTENCPVPTPE